MKKIFLFFIFVFALAFFTLNASAYGPNTHLNITVSEMNEISSTNLVKQLIYKNADTLDYCHMGLMFPDVSVIYYYTSFKDYKALHDWNLYTKLIELAKDENERAFAYCYGMHLAADSISHNYYVPDSIRRTKMFPNLILHPVLEIAVEGQFYMPETAGTFNRWNEVIPLMKEASGKDWSYEAKVLNEAIGGNSFYQTAYAPPKSGFINRFYAWLSSILEKVMPQSVGLPYRELTKSSIAQIFEGTHPALDPSGEASLAAADASINLWRWFVGFGILIGLYFLLRRFSLV